MKYYSTNKQAPLASLEKAVMKGLAEDRGLYMPERIQRLPQSFFDNIDKLSFQDIAFRAATAFFGEDIEADVLRQITDDTLSFDCPVVRVTDNIYALELFHGPTLAFKDVGARFMARLLRYFVSRKQTTPANEKDTPSTTASHTVNVLAATSGDTGSAVANGFLGVEGIHVYVLYPKGKVSRIQECQFTTLGRNITAIEVDGVFDDCQTLVKSAFADDELNSRLTLTSANSINVARLLPQTFYYLEAYARLKALGKADNLVVSVPSGNFGNITAALLAHELGMPVKRFIAADNANDTVVRYLLTGTYTPQDSRQTIANAMDVGNPSNFARILDLYGYDHGRITALMSGQAYSDDLIREAMRSCYSENGYILDPHGACGYRALKDQLLPAETGVFCETAHPAKFKNTVEQTLNISLPLPERLQAFMKGEKQTVPMSRNYSDFKAFLMTKD